MKQLEEVKEEIAALRSVVAAARPFTTESDHAPEQEEDRDTM